MRICDPQKTDKRPVLAGAVVFLVAALLAACPACRKKEPASGKTVLRFAHSTTGGATKPVLDWACEEFGKRHSGVVVEQICQSDDVYQTTGLQSLFQGGRPPDIYFEWAGWRVEEKARQGYAVDLTDALGTGDWRDSFLPNAWHQTSYGGRCYMVPNSISISVLYWYNKGLFADNGLGVPKTWDEMLDGFEKLRSAGIVPVGVGNMDRWPLGNWGAHLVSRWVGEEKYAKTLSLAPGTSFLDEDFVAALRLVQEWHKRKLFNKGFMGISSADGMQGFFQGRFACHPLGDWLISEALKDAAPGLEYDCFNLPPIPGGKGDQTSIMSLTTGHMIAPQTKHLDLCIEFLKWLSSQEVQKRLVEAGNFSPIKGVNEQAELGPQLKRILQIYSDARAMISPPDTGYNVQVANHFYDVIAAVASGESTPRQALELCEERVQPWRSKK